MSAVAPREESLKHAVLTRFHPQTDNFQVLLALVADNFYNLPTREEAECACSSAWGELVFRGIFDDVLMEVRFFHCKRGTSTVNDKKEIASCGRQIEWVDVQQPRSLRSKGCAQKETKAEPVFHRRSGRSHSRSALLKKKK